MRRENTIKNKEAAASFRKIVKEVGDNYTVAGLSKNKAHFVNLSPNYNVERKERLRDNAIKVINDGMDKPIREAIVQYQEKSMSKSLEQG